PFQGRILTATAAGGVAASTPLNPRLLWLRTLRVRKTTPSPLAAVAINTSSSNPDCDINRGYRGEYAAQPPAAVAGNPSGSKTTLSPLPAAAMNTSRSKKLYLSP